MNYISVKKKKWGKGIMKGYRHIQMKRYTGGGPAQKLCLRRTRVHHSPSTWMCSPTWKLIKSHCLRAFIEI